MRLSRLVLFLSLLFPFRAGAQNVPITALPFLEIPASPSINAMGGAGVAVTTGDPHAFLYNPAHLGVDALENQAAGTLYPGGSTDWLSIGDLTVGSTALSAGIDLRSKNIPLTVGIGLAQTALRFGERVFVDDEGRAMASYNPQDRYRALSLGVATTGPIRIGLGGTVRQITTTDRASVNGDEVNVSNLHGFSADFGLLAQADVTAVLGNPSFGNVRPSLSLSAGYSQSNIGGVVAYAGQGGAAPMPRTARLGWAASLGFDMPLGNQSLRFVQTDVSLQAEHLLVRQEAAGEYSYEPLIGDMSVFDHALRGQGNETVTGRQGLRITLAETLSISRGNFDGWGFDNVETRGMELHLAGPLKILGNVMGNESLSSFASNYDVRFTRSTYFNGEINESSFSGVSFVVKR